MSQELPPSSPQKEDLEFRKKGSQAPERNEPGQSLISSAPELQRHIRRQVICGKGHQRARKHSEEATDKQSHKGKDQHNRYHRDGKDLMLIIERPSLDILEGIGKGHDERRRHMSTIEKQPVLSR